MTERKSPIDQFVNLLIYAPVGAATAAQEKLPSLIDKGQQRLAGQVATARIFGQFAVGQGRKEAGQFVKQAGGFLSGLGVIPGMARPKSPTATPAKSTPMTPRPPAGTSGATASPTGTVSAPPDLAATEPLLPDPGAPAPHPGRTAPPRPTSTRFPADASAPDATPVSPAGPPPSNGQGPTGRANRAPSRGRTPSPERTTAPSDALAIPGYDSLSASQVVQRLAGLAPAELEAVRVYESTTRGRRTILSRVAQLQAEQRRE